MNSLKILTIVPYKFLPAKLGGEKAIAMLYENLGKLVEIKAVSVKDNELKEAKNFKIFNILNNSRIRYVDIFLYFKIRKVLINERSTHLLIEHPYFGWLGILLRKTLSIKFVVRSHNIEFMRSKSIGRKWWLLLKWYEGWVYRNADLNFFISDVDRNYAEDHLKIPPVRNHTLPYGVNISGIENFQSSKVLIRKKHNIQQSEKILMFNGALYHHTNYDAVRIIIDKVNPILLGSAIKYKIIICGKGLPISFNDLSDYSKDNIIYAGFVDNIKPYFEATDIFLNPILSGGGVKTKAIEALANNCTVVSTKFGALGIRKEVCGSKLRIVDDDDWAAFGQAILKSVDLSADIPKDFFDYYNWDKIVERAYNRLKSMNA